MSVEVSATSRDVAAEARAILESGAPDAIRDAVAVVDKAAGQGDPDAIAMQAHFLAIGVSGKADWDRSLQLLANAAERGSALAAGELRLLSGLTDASPADMIRRIDLRGLVAPRRTEVVSPDPRIRTAPQFLSRAECDWLVSRAAPRLAPAKVYDNSRLGGQLVSARNNTTAEFPLSDTDMVLILLRTRIANTIGLPAHLFEATSVLHYAVGQEFVRHVDYLDASQPGLADEIVQRGQRVATFLVYLNDDYEGGETEFPRVPFRFRGKPGDALVFANTFPDLSVDPRTLHAGLPPTRGEKWLLSQWIRNKPQ